MLVFGIISAVIIILFILILFLKFSVILSIKKGDLEVRVRVLGLKFKIPLEKKVKETEEAAKDENSVMKKFMDLRNDFHRIKEAIKAALTYLRYKIELYDMGILGDFGTGNAATTGVAYGSVQAFLSAISSLIGQYFELKRPIRVNVDLNFSDPVFNISFHAIVKARPIHLLIGVMKFLKANKTPKG